MGIIQKYKQSDAVMHGLSYESFFTVRCGTVSRDIRLAIHSSFEIMYPGFSLEIYFQMVHSTIGRFETPSLHTAIEMLSGKPG